MRNFLVLLILIIAWTPCLYAQAQETESDGQEKQAAQANSTPQEQASADEILFFANGDRLTGQLKAVREDEVLFSTAAMGEVRFPWVDVVQLESQRVLFVLLEGGEIVSGRISRGPQPEEWIITSARLGRVSVTREQVVAVGPTSESVQPSTLELEATKAELAEKSKALSEATDLTKLWSGSIEAGCSGNEGNKNYFQVHAKINVRRKTEHELFKAYLYGIHARSRRVRTASEIKGGASLDVDITEWLFIWGAFDAEWDEEEELNLRFDLALGSGVHIIKREKTFLDFKVGFGYIVEDYKYSEDHHNANAKAIVDFGHTFENKVQVGLTITYAPTLTDINNYRLIGEAYALFPITDHFKVKVSLIDEYNSLPAPGVKHNDFTWLASLVYEF